MSEFKVEISDSSLYTMSTINVFKPPSYECPVHGVVENLGTISLIGQDGSPISQHCMLCYQHWIMENIPAVKVCK